MAISLASVSASPLWLQAVVLAVVGIGMTAMVYGAVAIIVRADDWGAALARSSRTVWQGIGRAMVMGMPWFLAALSHLGMLAMLWVGGGILVHGAQALGWHMPEETIHAWAHAAAPEVAVLGGFVEWLVGAALSAVIGLAVGGLCTALEKWLLAPALARLSPNRQAKASA
jgi:predicted DNA repair protein MutK